MALDPTKVANTGARTAPSIVIKATNPQGQMISIGGIKRMSRTITRTTSRRRELDSNVPGITVEIIPGPVTAFEIRISRAMLNSSTMLEGFGITGLEDLIYQNIPLTVEEHRFQPNGKEQVVTYTGCYFKDNPIDIDIDGDWQIVQEATLEVATCTVRNPS